MGDEIFPGGEDVVPGVDVGEAVYREADGDQVGQSGVLSGERTPNT